jgi:hypothetical protein
MKALAISAVVVKAVVAAALMGGYHVPSHADVHSVKYLILLNEAKKGRCRNCAKTENGLTTSGIN